MNVLRCCVANWCCIRWYVMQWLEIGKVASCGVHCQCTHPLLRWLHHILPPVFLYALRNGHCIETQEIGTLIIVKIRHFICFGADLWCIIAIFYHHISVLQKSAMLRQGTGLSVPPSKFAYDLFQHWLFVVTHRVRWCGAVCANQPPPQSTKMPNMSTKPINTPKAPTMYSTNYCICRFTQTTHFDETPNNEYETRMEDQSRKRKGQQYLEPGNTEMIWYEMKWKDDLMLNGVFKMKMKMKWLHVVSLWS